MPAAGLFHSRAPRGGAAGGWLPRRRARSLAALLGALAMVLLYRCVLIPRIRPAPLPAAPRQDVGGSAGPLGAANSPRDHSHAAGVDKARHAAPAHHQERSSVPKASKPRHEAQTGSSKVAAKLSELELPQDRQSVVVTEQKVPKPPPKPEPPRPAPKQVQTSSGEGAHLSANSPKRHHAKEQVMDADMQSASSVVDTLTFPKTHKWERRAKRVVVNKQDSTDKYLKGQSLIKHLPAQDLPVNKHSTCAVVGNGGVMLSKPWGAGIDRHDAVFRFNDGPTVGFERNVGSKTTYRLINNKWAHYYTGKHPRGASEENIVLFGHGAAGQAGKLIQMWPHENIVFMAPEFAGQARGQYKNGQAALSSMGVIKIHGRNSAPTGIEGIFMALALCQKVHLYGFGIDTDPSVPYHYHDKVKGVEAAHSFGFQALLLKLLNYKGIFGLCVPGHDTEDCEDPASSDLSAYDTAVEAMAAAAEANPEAAKIAAAAAIGADEDGDR